MTKSYRPLAVYMAVISAILFNAAGKCSLAISTPASQYKFPVAAHSNVNIEWWYLNAHVTTTQGKHYAIIGSFFRFGNGISPFDPLQQVPRAHYLIYAVTDLDKKTHQSYSLADSNMATLYQYLSAKPIAEKQTALPAQNSLITGPCKINNSPFRIAYGIDNSLAANNAADTQFALRLGKSSSDRMALNFVSQKKPMAVGGNGETGLVKPSDMHYFSLTRCAVTGTIDTGSGTQTVANGQGWIDHQWGDSWVAQNDGWDWWGVQLTNGTDILLFRQRNLKTGKVFYPLATIMDKSGKLIVTRNITFTQIPSSLWTSKISGVTYPLAWIISLPSAGLSLFVSAAVKDQEMQILGPGGSIWEGACNVSALTKYIPSQRDKKSIATWIPGVAYMELVGYNSQAVKMKLNLPTKTHNAP